MSEIHAVSEEEAKRLELRARAVSRFKKTYSHNRESQRTMVGALRRVARTFSKDKTLTENEFAWEVIASDRDWPPAIMAALAANYRRKTLQKDASAIRTILDCCRKEGLISHEAFLLAEVKVPKKAKPDEPPGEYLTEADVADLIATAANGAANHATRIRDVALLLTLASTGARGDEVSHADIKHLTLADRRLWLAVTKSGTPRDSWLHPAAVEALERWLTVRGHGKGPLFPPLSRTGRPLLAHGAMTTGQVQEVVRTHARTSGRPGVSTHDLRRFVITTLLTNGHDIALVARTVGHSNPTTTAGYDQRPAQVQREAIASIKLPALPND